MKFKSIAIFLPSLSGGGAEHMMLILANEFSKMGYSVELVLAKYEGPYLNKVNPNVKIVNLKSKRVISSLIPLIRYLKTRKPEVLLSALNHANIIAIIAKFISGSKTNVVISERNNLSTVINNNKNLANSILVLLMKFFYPLAHATIAISHGVADDLSKTIGIKKDKISVVYNPAVTDDIREKSLENISHPWFEKNSPPVIIAVGRLTPQKDFQTLIKAFSIIRKEKKCKLVILGEGESRGDLEKLISQHMLNEDIALPGFVENPLPWMRNSSVFVMSSAWEGFGNVLVEAMACGTAVVSTDCPSGPNEILENGKWGRLVPVGNSFALADAILKTLEDEIIPNVAERAKNFNSLHAANGYLNVINRLFY